jgi:hypothetical protein
MAVFCNFKSYGTLVLLVCYAIAIAMFVTSRVTQAIAIVVFVTSRVTLVLLVLLAVLLIRIRIRRICMFLGLPDLELVVRDMFATSRVTLVFLVLLGCCYCCYYFCGDFTAQHLHVDVGVHYLVYQVKDGRLGTVLTFEVVEGSCRGPQLGEDLQGVVALDCWRCRVEGREGKSMVYEKMLPLLPLS